MCLRRQRARALHVVVAVCAVIAATRATGLGAELILDNDDPGTSSSGLWKVSGASNPYGEDSLYASKNDAGPVYTFEFTLAAAGSYEVCAWWTSLSSRESAVPIEIVHAGGSDTVHVDQRQNGGKWNLLGAYDFGSSAIIRVHARGGPYTTCADAIRLVQLTAASQPPVASIESIAPNPALEGSEVQFVGAATDADGQVVQYEWASDRDGVISSSAQFASSSLSVGTHSISFRARDDSGAWSAPDSASLTIESTANSPPTASISSISPNPAAEGSRVDFAGSATDSDGQIAGYEWTSDLDGVLSTGDRFWTTSLSVGTHEIRFRARDDVGVWSSQQSASLSITGLPNFAPTATIVSVDPLETDEGNPVTFEGAGSDLDGTIAQYEWVSNQDGVLSVDPVFTTTSLSPLQHTVSFRVRDDDGAWSSARTTQVQIHPVTQPTIEVIVDNGDPETSSTGNWRSSGFAGHYGADSVYMGKNGSGYTYTYLVPLDPGDYDVFIWWTSGRSRDPATPVEIEHAEGIDEYTIDQQANGGQWNAFGVYPVDEYARITITSRGVGYNTSADAVRFVRVGGSTPDPDPEPDPDPDPDPDPEPPLEPNVFVAPLANGGSEGNSGMSRSSPWTIQKAGLEMRPGDVVECKGGVYTTDRRDRIDSTGATAVAVGGSATGGYVTFQSAPGEEAIFDGPFKFQGEHRFIRFRDVSWRTETKLMVSCATAEDFVFENVRFTAIDEPTAQPAVVFRFSERISFIDCQFAQFYNSDQSFDFLVFDETDQALVRRCNFVYAEIGGIKHQSLSAHGHLVLLGCTNSVVQDSIFRNIADRNISIRDKQITSSNSIPNINILVDGILSLDANHASSGAAGANRMSARRLILRNSFFLGNEEGSGDEYGGAWDSTIFNGNGSNLTLEDTRAYHNLFYENKNNHFGITINDDALCCFALDGVHFKNNVWEAAENYAMQLASPDIPWWTWQFTGELYVDSEKDTILRIRPFQSGPITLQTAESIHPGFVDCDYLDGALVYEEAAWHRDIESGDNWKNYTPASIGDARQAYTIQPSSAHGYRDASPMAVVEGLDSDPARLYLDDAKWFWPRDRHHMQEGDRVIIGSSAPVEILSINLSSDRIELSAPVNAQVGDRVYFASGGTSPNRGPLSAP